MIKNIFCKSLVKSALVILLSQTVISCASTGKQESTGEYVDSTVITTRVKTALLNDKEIHSLPITVKTFKNTVQLSGFVDSYSQKFLATEITKNVPGVTSVQNMLIVK